MAWAALYSGLVEYMRNVAMWVLCVNCGMDCGLPVTWRHLTELESLGGSDVGVVFPLASGPASGTLMKTLGFRSHTS